MSVETESAGRGGNSTTVRPKGYGAPHDVLCSQRTKVATVEARRVIREKEHVSGPESSATVPGGHWACVRFRGKCERGEATTDKYVNAEAANTVSGDGRDGFQEIRGAREISSTVGQNGHGLRQLNEHQVA
jgi:hypothetical protein